jgi:hypothetical protein
MARWAQGERQARALEVLREVAEAGITARELAQRMVGNDVSGVNGWGAPLTLLRQAGRIVGLEEKRLDHHVYVLPEHVAARATWAGYRHTGHCKTCTCDQED